MSSGSSNNGTRSRVTPLALCCLLAAVACGDDETTGGGGSGGQPSGGGGEMPGGGGEGGTGGDGGTGGTGGTGGAPNGGGGSGAGGGGPSEIAALTEGRAAFDAAPSPDGSSVYFTAIEADGTPGVYEASPGGGATLLTASPLFAAPLGIATSTTGETLYIADSAADEGGADRGAIFSLPAAGGTPVIVSGTAGLSPRNLEVRQINNVDQIYFTGRTDAGAAAIYRIPSGGGAATLLVSSGLVDPSGIAVASNGDLYVVDTVGSGRGAGRVLFVQDGSNTVEEVVDDFDAGFPAGCALNLSESQLWVSGLDAATLTTSALILDTTSLDVTFFTGDADTDLTGNFEPGGIHRAKDADTFGWVDARAGANGTVYLITH